MPATNPRSHLLAASTGLAAVLAAIALAAPGSARAAEPADRATQAIVESLTAAQKAQRGVTLWVGGQAVGGAVVRIDDASVELKNQTHSRIVVRLSRIDGAAW